MNNFWNGFEKRASKPHSFRKVLGTIAGTIAGTGAIAGGLHAATRSDPDASVGKEALTGAGTALAGSAGAVGGLKGGGDLFDRVYHKTLKNRGTSRMAGKPTKLSKTLLRHSPKILLASSALGALGAGTLAHKAGKKLRENKRIDNE